MKMGDIMSLQGNLFPSIGFVQFEIEAADPERNIKRIEEELSKVNPDLNSLVILPELWATGFAYRKMDMLADQTNDILGRLSEIAKKYSITFGGSLPEKVQEATNISLYNTFYFTGNEKIFGKIRKQHLFSPINEDKWFSPGGYQKSITTPFGMIGGCVCYDIRFPEVVQHFCRQGAHVFTVTAQWPEARIDHWCALLKARAIENQTFVVACNGLGSCNGIQLGGNSLIIDPAGKIIINAGNRAGAYFAPINWQSQHEIRRSFNTIAPSRSPVEYKEKIVHPEECIQVITRRTLLGQKVICVRLQRERIDVESIEFLQKMRKEGDYLVVVAETVLLRKNDMLQSETVLIPHPDRAFFAALDCVDMVVDGSNGLLASFENTVEKVVIWN